MKISFICKELITCGAILSTFELCEALNRLGHQAYIVSEHNNLELEEYFDVKVVRRKRGTTIAVAPKCKGEYAYVRTKDGRWTKHEGKMIAVSEDIADWLATEGIEVHAIIGNGTHERFTDLKDVRDIEVLVEGNNEPNKNIEETIEMARGYSKKGHVHWMGRTTKEIDNVTTITNPKIEDIPKIYNRTKVFIKKSHHEGWGRPVAEARACKVPLIINQSGGNKFIELVSWEIIAKQLIHEIL